MAPMASRVKRSPSATTARLLEAIDLSIDTGTHAALSALEDLRSRTRGTFAA
jgi:hypothetical protein